MTDDLYKTRREPRPCKTCGYVRVVKIRDDRRFIPDGTTRRGLYADEPGGEFKVVGECYEALCRACQLTNQIYVYERAIAKIRGQIVAERARQSRARARAKGKP